MKLLSFQNLKDKKDENQLRELLRLQEITKVSEKTRNELADSQANFSNALAKNRDVWANEEVIHSKRMVEMKREVDILEAKKVQALIPIRFYEKQAEDVMIRVQSRLLDVINKEKENEELTEKLTDKLDDIGDREVQVRTAELKLANKKQGIELQEQQMIKNSKFLTNQMQEFALQRTEIEKDIDIRKTALILAERSIDANRESLKRTEKELNELAIKLADERETLKRAFARLPK